ncbi:hypothetical protein PRIPAC_76005 [Pristionchus pacificus]|uniref:Aldose 1-epimerase n=1 Tax=Pristionchus pacificus TaxID=54126 RepID=A0A454XR98_PRIPA|nr:hypothetical protein PRIPAC_76005 [Pristionchus pacificus]|eukprot:PDM80605.1 hypothetical protein PRIPAC_35608 [Pristionchus pacificus]
MSSDDSPIEFIDITNDEGLRARVLTWGATLVSLWFKDKNGREHDCVLGYDTIDEYKSDRVQMGKTIGRVSNRIKNGEFEVNEEKIQVEKNEGNNHLHGGPKGCSQRNWSIHRRAHNSVTFLITQTHDLDGYPGDANMKCTYTVNDLNQLVVEHWAETTVPCPIAMTNHAYWNLDNDSTTCLDHHLFVRAHYYLPVDDDKCPNGDTKPVFGTSYNFNKMRRIGPSPPIDHDLILTDHEKTKIVLALENPTTGIRMTMRTTYPSIHIYSAEQFDGSIIGKGGRSYPESAGIAIEPQQYTSAVHFDWFPPVIVDPSTPYEQEIIYSFQHIQPKLIA